MHLFSEADSLLKIEELYFADIYFQQEGALQFVEKLILSCGTINWRQERAMCK